MYLFNSTGKTLENNSNQMEVLLVMERGCLINLNYLSSLKGFSWMIWVFLIFLNGHYSFPDFWQGFLIVFLNFGKGPFEWISIFGRAWIISVFLIFWRVLIVVLNSSDFLNYFEFRTLAESKRQKFMQGGHSCQIAKLWNPISTPLADLNMGGSPRPLCLICGKATYNEGHLQYI
jgi:hypothetical protein